MTTDATKATHATDATVTDEAVSSLDGTADPRLRELLTGLIRHLHAFARETRLTQEEWERAVGFLRRPGRRARTPDRSSSSCRTSSACRCWSRRSTATAPPAPPSRRSSAPST